MTKHRSSRTLLLLAAALLLPVGGVPAAGAMDPAAGPTAFTGTVNLPDGTTPAKGAVVDLSLAGAAPFARGLADLDGLFSVDVPETAELVALALAGGGTLTVRWTASDLYPQTGTPPPQVSTQAALGAVQTSPGFGQVTGEFVAYLIDTTTNAVANALSDPKMVEFHLPDVAGIDPIVMRVADLVAAAGIYNDPDLVAGKEDLDDPDLIPPLGSELDVIPLTEITSTASAPPSPPDNDLVRVDVGLPGGSGVVPSLRQEEAGGGGGTGSPCTLVRTYWFPEDGSQQPMNGVRMSTTIKAFRCKNEEDDDHAYWGFAMDGWVRGLDEASGTYGGVNIWRYKYRVEALRNDYRFMQVDPRQNDKNGGRVDWSVGLSPGGPSGSISGTFTPGDPGWMHPWPEDTDRKLFHVSFISDSKWGAHGGPYWNGGGATYRVPKNTSIDSFVSNMRREVLVWRCWMQHTEREYQWFCDPRS